ncbi:unnamed protein product [Cylicocyclus nassatus]|uniref:Uncharacterized protein n=1 Tax=Cylicocyclus nassatus TaxID=53992 RepID=A0AA36M1T3_CYLNA|nr:unnamed protein product [Cylicocyclus nassatus]
MSSYRSFTVEIGKNDPPSEEDYKKFFQSFQSIQERVKEFGIPSGEIFQHHEDDEGTSNEYKSSSNSRGREKTKSKNREEKPRKRDSSSSSSSVSPSPREMASEGPTWAIPKMFGVPLHLDPRQSSQEGEGTDMRQFFEVPPFFPKQSRDRSKPKM